MHLPSIIPMEDGSRVAEARRLAVVAAGEEGLNDQARSSVGVVTTEAATNLLKHAKEGELHISRLSDRGVAGVEVLSIDRGPGMADFHRCLEDGYSSVGTAGTGLGAIARLSSESDAYSVPGKGTVLVSRVRPAKSVNSTADLRVGAVRKAIRGESICGDAWAVREEGKTALFIVADGLGHGPFAAQASEEAVAAFFRGRDTSPAALLGDVHRALRSTRGAAVAIASVSSGERKVRFAGLGNIGAVMVRPGKTQHMISHNGTAGHEAHRVQEFSYALPEDAVVIMHSDGLSFNWNLETYPSLIRRHASVIAGTLYRDAARLRDDACVVVVQREQAA